MIEKISEVNVKLSVDLKFLNVAFYKNVWRDLSSKMAVLTSYKCRQKMEDKVFRKVRAIYCEAHEKKFASEI